MSITAIANYFDDTEQQCKEWLGEIRFSAMMDDVHTRGYRLGHSFWRALTLEDRFKLQGTDVDPYHRQNWDAIQKALDYLLEH